MNNELALRTLGYLIGHYKTHNETIINSQEIEAINFILEENQELKKENEEYKRLGFKHLQNKCNKLEEQLEEWIELLNKFKNQQKEFIEYLQNKIKQQEGNGDWEYVYGAVLSKYKEIIGAENEN